MTNFNEREKAFENKFALDEEQRFRAWARRNRLAAAWAGGLIGREDLDVYAAELVEADLAEAGDEDLVRRLVADFEAAGLGIGAAEIRVKLLELAAQAAAQVQQE